MGIAQKKALKKKTPKKLTVRDVKRKVAGSANYKHLIENTDITLEGLTDYLNKMATARAKADKADRARRGKPLIKRVKNKHVICALMKTTSAVKKMYFNGLDRFEDTKKLAYKYDSENAAKLVGYDLIGSNKLPKEIKGLIVEQST